MTAIMKLPLKNKWVLITGASSGFGAAAAKAFAAEGAKLLLGARRIDRLQQTAAASLEAGAAAAEVHGLDVSQTASVDAFVEWVRTKTLHVNVLVNNAGGAHGMDSVAAGRDQDWETMFQTNVLGILRVTRAVLPLIPHDWRHFWVADGCADTGCRLLYWM
jgi:3-hydroxy acid dehydrogenase / malonic semialdehyde reductase